VERFVIDNCSRKGPFVRIILESNELKDLGTHRLPSEQLALGCYMLFWPDKESLNLVGYLGPRVNQPFEPLPRLRLLLSQVKGYAIVDSPAPQCAGVVSNEEKR